MFSSNNIMSNVSGERHRLTIPNKMTAQTTTSRKRSSVDNSRKIKIKAKRMKINFYVNFMKGDPSPEWPPIYKTNKVNNRF